MDGKRRFQQIKDHFEKEALLFDRFFFKVMPRYQELTQALVDSLPFRKTEKLKFLDLGCGTGNLAQKIISGYPRAQITCLDMAENMLKMARVKLGRNPNVSFWQGDIRDFDYSGKYDAIVSSMALHHIEGREKTAFYRRLRKALKNGGVFITVDIFLSSNGHLQKFYMDKWKAYMRSNGLPDKRINDMIARHRREDRPVIFIDELAMLERAGFKDVDVIAKYYNFAVNAGLKR
jgi:tRNA (cmo5U34)-methyltransferase